MHGTLDLTVEFKIVEIALKCCDYKQNDKMVIEKKVYRGSQQRWANGESHNLTPVRLEWQI